MTPFPSTDARPDELIDKAELAKRLGLEPCTIEDWVSDRKIPFIRPTKKVLRFNWPRVVDHLTQKYGVNPFPGGLR